MSKHKDRYRGCNGTRSSINLELLLYDRFKATEINGQDKSGDHCGTDIFFNVTNEDKPTKVHYSLDNT